MKAVITTEAGGPEVLQMQDRDAPKPEMDEVLIRVKAAAVNRTDILNREGKAGYIENPVLGIEVAGVVEEAGTENPFSPGDRVMGLVNGGGYAEYAVMRADRVMRIPETFTYAEAAAVPEVFLTAYQTLYWIGHLNQHESVLVHAGGSGVGTAAIQLASQLSSARVLTTAGSAEKLEFTQKLGADVCINYKEQNFEEEVLAATDDKGVNVILDFVGASYWEQNLKSIQTDGRWVLIGVLGGANVPNVNLMKLLMKRVQLTGTLLTPRSDEYKAELSRDFVKHAMPHLEDGSIRPIVDTVFPFEQIADAHRHMQDNKNIGKIVLEW